MARAGLVEPCAERGELGTHAVAFVGPGRKRESQLGGAKRARKITALLERGDQVVEHAHRGLVWGPRPYERRGSIARDFDAAVERIEQQRLGATEMRDDVVARDPTPASGTSARRAAST